MKQMSARLMTLMISTTLLWACVSTTAMGADRGISLDCTKTQSKVERLVCDNPELSKLDSELAEVYKAALQDKANAQAIKQIQKQWRKELDMCGDAECVSWMYQGRTMELQNTVAQILLTKAPTQKQIENDRKAGFKGEYFLTKSEDLICVPFTKNLNQFRKLDFDECHPRLSEKFPEFARPEWREVQLDLEIAEKAFKGFGGSKLKPGEGTYWQNWLKETAELRASGQVKMWLTDVDINNDGVIDPIARVQYAHPASDLPVKQRGCVYSHSGLWKLSPELDRLRNGQAHLYFGRDADIIFDKKSEAYYSLEWAEGQVGPILQGLEIGATHGVLVEAARGTNDSFGPVCHINWVPTGKYRPLQRKTTPSKHIN